MLVSVVFIMEENDAFSLCAAHSVSARPGLSLPFCPCSGPPEAHLHRPPAGALWFPRGFGGRVGGTETDEDVGDMQLDSSPVGH